MKTKDKEKMVEALQSKSEAKLIAKEYVEKEAELLKELEKLDRFGEVCNCNDVEIIRTIHEGELPEISTYCLNCGGYIEEY